MQENKYFYEGIPITEYAKQHGLNPNTLRTRIWKKRNNPKYQNLTDEEIVSLVIKSCGTSIKYTYQGMTLRQYCLKNNLNIGTITSRITKLKSENPKLSNDELVRLSIEEFENHNFTLYYHGEELKTFCLKENINYNTLRTYINREKYRNASLTTDEVVDMYLAKEHFGIYRYYYLGIPLRKYCSEKNISYEAIIGRILRYRKSNEIVGDDELVEMIMSSYEPNTPKYYYQEETLNTYCSKNKISYYSVVSYIKRKKEKFPDYSIDELIKEAIKSIKKQGIIYYYAGIPLIDYAKLHNLNASSIRSSILRKRESSNLPLQEIVNLCVETYEKAKIKYYYHDEPLFNYCKKNNLNYNTIISRYLDLNLEETDEQRKITIASIVEDLLKNPKKRTKYFFMNESLHQFCKNNNYSYTAIWSRIKKFKEEFTYTLDTEIVTEAVLTYEEKNIIRKNNAYFNDLENNESIIITDYITSLNIDIESVKEMLDMGFDSKQTLLLIYFIGNNNPKEMNDFLLRNLYLSINKFNKKEPLDFYTLYVLYKTCIENASNEIISYFKNINKSLIEEYSLYYRKLTKEELDTLYLNLNSYILMLIDYIYLDNKEMLIKHLMYLQGEYIRKYYESLTQDNHKLHKI